MPASTIYLGAVGAVIYNLSASRLKKLQTEIKDYLAGLESRTSCYKPVNIKGGATVLGVGDLINRFYFAAVVLVSAEHI